MASSTVPAARPAARTFPAVARFWWVAAGLFLLAAALRAYRLGADPLWLDEIITTDVARGSLAQVFTNSLTDPHPPLYYLLMWFVSGFGALRAEWTWRLPSMLAGALSVPALYALARRTAGEWPALLVAVWLAVLPTSIYFSQEARWPALTLLLVIGLTIVFVDLLRQPADRRRWALYAVLAVAALFTSYSTLPVVGMQLLFILWALRKERGALGFALVLVAALGLQVALAANTLPRIAAEHSATTRPLLVDDLLQSLLAGDLSRYGSFWAHRYLVGAMLLMAALGAWHAWRVEPGGLRAYAALQVVTPLAAYALVAQPLLHLNLPNYETRQFLVLLPALLVLMAHGLAQLQAWLPRAVFGAGALAFTVVVIAGSAQGLARYWAVTRSPEGHAVQYVAARLQPGDALIALDYFSSAALRYYLPDPPAYNSFRQTDAGLQLYHVGRGEVVTDQSTGMPLAAVQAHPRLWVFSVPDRLDAHLTELIAGCQLVEMTDFLTTPIRVQLVTACAAAPAP